MKKTWRVEIIELIPWVTRLKKERTCDGYLWSRMPLKAIYGPDPTLKERYRCKRSATWKFKALKRSQAHDGVYCWSHLMAMAYHDMDEMARMSHWFDTHQDVVDEIRARHGMSSVAPMADQVAD